MEYTCLHCLSDLDRGDVLDHFLKTCENPDKAVAMATNYGWSDTNRVHFTRSVIVQPEHGVQYTICPDCKKINPFNK